MDKDTEKIIKLYAEGKSVKTISIEMRCSKNKVSGRLKKAGVKIRGCKEAAQARSKRLEPFTQDIVRMYKQGYSIVDVTAEFSTSQPVIRRILLENGVKLRSRSEAMIVRRKPGSLNKEYKKVKEVKRCICCGAVIPSRPIDGVYLTRLCALCWRSDAYEPPEFFERSWLSTTR